MSRLPLSVLALALSAVAVPALGQAPIAVTLTDAGFEPAEITVAAGEPFTLVVHNASAAAAEIEAKDLRVEKVVAAGADITINLRAQDPGTYLFVNEYKEDRVFGHITVK